MGNVETAKESYEAFGRGDLMALSFTDDVVWVTSDELPLGGEVKGRDEVLGNFAQLPNYWSEFSVTPERFIDAGDTVVVTGTQKATGKGGSFEAPFVHILEYRDGRAYRGEFYGDTAKGLRALGD
jgi:ketosteroid isomerase-like protein